MELRLPAGVNVMSGVAMARAFERLGQIREHLTALQDIAADVEDPTFSLHVRSAMHTNTLSLEHINERMNPKTTEPAGAHLDSERADGLRRS